MSHTEQMREALAALDAVMEGCQRMRGAPGGWGKITMPTNAAMSLVFEAANKLRSALTAPAAEVPWSVHDGGAYLQHDDVRFDAVLRLDGDFETQDQRLEFAEAVRDALNGAAPAATAAEVPEAMGGLTCTMCGGSPGACGPICNKATAATILANTLVEQEDKGKRAERVQRLHALLKEMAAAARLRGGVPEIDYTPGNWYEAKDRDDLQAFFLSRLPAIREAAREHGYAIGLHGSLRRDMDLIAVPWREGASDKDVLAHAIAMAACGITRDGPYQWEQKPLGRVAASLSCCWPRWFNEAGAGHIDLSVMGPLTAAPQAPAAALDAGVVPEIVMAGDKVFAGIFKNEVREVEFGAVVRFKTFSELSVWMSSTQRLAAMSAQAGKGGA